MVAFNDHQSLPYPTIRRSSCEYLLLSDSAAKCQECRKYTSTLRAQLSRHNSHQAALVVRTDPSSHVSYHCLTEEEKIERMKKLHEKLRTTQKERDRLKAKLAKVVKCEGVNVDSTTNADLHTIAQSEAFRVVEKFSPGSFQRIYLVSAFAHVHSNMLQRTRLQYIWEVQ